MNKQIKILLLVDDEECVHTVTKTILQNHLVAGRSLEFISAYSGKEAKEILAEHDGIALVLLDVTMETAWAGFDVVEHVRHQLYKRMIRIVIRTGQPGEISEARVTMDHEGISGYLAKEMLSQQDLLTTVTTSLRMYQELHLLDTERENLERRVGKLEEQLSRKQ